MAKTTLSVKVSAKSARRIRKFCDKRALQVGKFVESALDEVMEDYHFGKKAQGVLSENESPLITHDDYFKK